MLHCNSADPLRRRIFEMKARGAADNDVVNTIVREEGVVALAAPPANGLGGLITWLMPGIMLGLGFLVYTWYVRRIRRHPEPLSAGDLATLDRFRSQIDHELD